MSSYVLWDALKGIDSSRMFSSGHASDLVIWYSPSPSAVQEALLSMPNHVGNRSLLSQALSLLSYLAHQVDSLSKEERAAVLIVGDDDGLHSIDTVFYNDLGSRAALVALPNEVRLAHRCITEEYARAFSLAPLSSLHITDEAEDDDDMGETLTARIGGALRQYRPKQMFTEFLANAVDAGSRTMSILLDQTTFPTESILSRSMAQFQTSPALVFHNDAVFTDADFQGIKRVGTGSKRSRPGKIGRFGLGALSAYHVTEVSRTLPTTDDGSSLLIEAARLSSSSQGTPCYSWTRQRSTWLLPSVALLGSSRSKRCVGERYFFRHLDETTADRVYARRLFPDQLAPFEGLFGFSVSETDYYNGVRSSFLSFVLQGHTADTFAHRPCSGYRSVTTCRPKIVSCRRPPSMPPTCLR